MTRHLHADFTVRRSDAFMLELALDVAPGTTVALLGPNGAGKSTAVATLAGLLPVDTGRIGIGGRVLDDATEGVLVPPDERRIGVVFQHYLLFPHLTVVENVAFGLRATKTRRDEAHGIAEQWVGRLGLRGLETRRPRDLSGGQAQRVALARALATEPDLLLLDEPLSALDVTTRTEMRHVLAEHLDVFPGPRLLITHDPAEALLLADDIHIVEAGVVTQRGTADDIRLRPRTSYAADLAGVNLVTGTASGGNVETGGHLLHIADDIDGPVLLTIQPTSVSLHPRRPEGSPRNAWPTTVERIESRGSRIRLRTGAPLPLAVEVTESARAELGIEPGTELWVAVKATEISVQPDPAPASGDTAH